MTSSKSEASLRPLSLIFALTDDSHDMFKLHTVQVFVSSKYATTFAL